MRNLRRIALAICAALLASAACADRAGFFKDGKPLGRMFVDSAEGLRVRERPSLGAARVCGLSHRSPVKVIAVGREETIDGITAPWVEILIPRYEWKGGEPEFGWVFGGYLKPEQPDFVAPKDARELADYLSTHLSWAFYDKHGESIGFMHFYRDGSFSEIHPRPGDPGYRDRDFSDGERWYGTWRALGSSTFSVSASNPETGETLSRAVSLVSIGDVWWCESLESQSAATMFSSKPVEGNAYHEIKTVRDGSVLKTKGAYLSDYWGGLYPDREYYDGERYSPPKALLMEYTKAGINVDSYKNGYMFDSYWDPIIAEHQRKADEMR